MGERKAGAARHDPTTKDGWKPYTMRAPILITFMVVSLCLAGVIEFFAQRSLRNGGLALSTSVDEIPRSVTIAYLYLPTIVSVLYSIAWTWIDLDIRRIQPWLELSQPGGAAAESSLLLDYPFEFLAFVPFKAWRQRHLPVFFAGLTMMIIFWAITPLQTAILGTQAVVLTMPQLMLKTSGLLQVEQQAIAMDGSILNNAYGVTWLNQEFPSYTTAEYAVLPFMPTETRALYPNETWEGQTTKFTTNLTCWPASIRKSKLANTYEYDNEQGCKVQVSLYYDNPTNNPSRNTYVHSIQYIGYYESDFLDLWLEGPSCSQNSSHQFLAIYSGYNITLKETDKMTALFCEPSYYKQDVSITLLANNRRPDDASMVPRGEVTKLSANDLNSTAFEALMGMGIPPVAVRRDYPDDIVLQQFFQLFEQDITWPLTPMVGFALGRTNLSMGQLSDPESLAGVFSTAHRMIFSMALPKILSDTTTPVAATGAVQYVLYGVVVSRPIAIAVEVLLLIAALLTATILYCCSRCISHLYEDPASMGKIFEMLSNSKPLLDNFAPKDCLDQDTLTQRISGQLYALTSVASDSKESSQLRLLQPYGTDGLESRSVDGFYPVRPKELGPLAGVGLIIILLVVGTILTYLKAMELHLKGLPRPSDNFNILQILENYIPTIFATLLESFLILLNRLICILQPFRDLRRGRKPARKTIDTTYSSVPPQFVVWKALRSGHFLLTTACVMSLLTNILAVALGGLFNEFPVSIDTTVPLQQAQTDALGRSTITPSNLSTISDTYSGHFYVVMANMTSGTKLPPWVDFNFAFLPFYNQETSSDNTSAVFRGWTRGFGVEATCTTLSTSPDAPWQLSYTFMANGTQSLSVTYQDGETGPKTCLTESALTGTPYLPAFPPVGVSAQELFTSLRPEQQSDGYTGNPDNSGFCERKLLVSWMRTDSADTSATVQATHLECTPVFRTAMFDVSVDPSGYVLNATRVSDFDTATGINSTQIEALMKEANGLVSDSPGLAETSMAFHVNERGWHNDTLTRDWMNYLLKVFENSTSLIDPAKPVPDPEYVLPLVQNMYQRLFATLLGLNIDIFEQLPQPVEISGTMEKVDTRIFMDETAFIVTIVILSSNVLFALILYSCERRSYLPRLPSTIGSIIAYVAASRAVREHITPGKKGKGYSTEEMYRTYSFGRYMGVDKKPHVGIEFDPLVVTLDHPTRNGELFRRRKGKCDSPSGWV